MVYKYVVHWAKQMHSVATWKDILAIRDVGFEKKT